MYKCPGCGKENPATSKFCSGCGGSLSGTQTGKLNTDTVLEGRYVIVKTLGQGGMGAVYLALDTRLKNMPVAIKEMSTRAVGGDLQAAVDGFQKEAALLVGLKHSALPMIRDFFPREENRWYLVMDYIEGHNLKEEVLKRGPIPEDEVVNWANQLCAILDYLHNCTPPIIFRDLKPDNIMLTPTGQIKLIDFGIARHFQQDNNADTVAYGSSGFAPPEQYGENQTDSRADIYALGATLHFLLTGIDPAKKPFSFDLPSKFVQVSTELEKVIMKAVDLKIENRPQRIREFQQLMPQYLSKTMYVENEASTMPLNINELQSATVATQSKPNLDLNATMPASAMKDAAMKSSQAKMLEQIGWNTSESEPRYVSPQSQPKKGGTVWLVLGLVVVIGITLSWFFLFDGRLAMNNQDLSQETMSDARDDSTVRQSDKEDQADTADEDGLVNFTAIENIIAAENQGGNYGVYVKELDCEKSYGTRNKEQQMIAAGLVFVPILYEALSQIDNGQLDEQASVTISQGMLAGGTGILTAKDLGDSYSIRDLMYMMMNHSDNTAANILIDQVGGMSQINETMRQCGLGSTYINRRLMDKNAMNRGIENYTSAEDMGKLLELCLDKQGESYFTKAPPAGMEQVLMGQDFSIAHQVGLLTKVYNDAGIIIGPDNRTIYVILSAETNNNQAQQLDNKIITSICKDLQLL